MTDMIRALFVRTKLFAVPLLLTASLLSGGCGTTAYESVATPQDDSTAAPDTDSADKGVSDAVCSAGQDLSDTGNGTLYAYICGAVKKSGVYELPAGSRIAGLIEAAGGLSEEADETLINQAAVLSDGQQVTVLTKEEAKAAGLVPAISPCPAEYGGRTAAAVPGSPAEGSASPEYGTGREDGLVNINTAGLGELTTLNGIGESRAADIIAYREREGGFQTIEDIMNVSGIKNAVFEKIKDRITV